MSSSAASVDSIDNRYYRRAGVTAVFYAIIDFLILVFGGPLVPLRLIGVIAAYFVVRDTLILREAGVEWGWTRYVVLVLVAIGGFLGFIIYAWRRHSHLEDHSWPDAETPGTGAEPRDTAGEADSDTATATSEGSDTAKKNVGSDTAKTSEGQDTAPEPGEEHDGPTDEQVESGDQDPGSMDRA